MVIRNHDWMGCPNTNDSTSVVGHGKVNVEANALAVVTTVTSNTQREHDSTRGKAEYFGAIELNDVERLGGAISGGIGCLW
jgi:hypothetical protein